MNPYLESHLVEVEKCLGAQGLLQSKQVSLPLNQLMPVAPPFPLAFLAPPRLCCSNTSGGVASL